MGRALTDSAGSRRLTEAESELVLANLLHLTDLVLAAPDLGSVTVHGRRDDLLAGRVDDDGDDEGGDNDDESNGDQPSTSGRVSRRSTLLDDAETMAAQEEPGADLGGGLPVLRSMLERLAVGCNQEQAKSRGTRTRLTTYKYMAALAKRLGGEGTRDYLHLMLQITFRVASVDATNDTEERVKSFADRTLNCLRGSDGCGGGGGGGVSCSLRPFIMITCIYFTFGTLPGAEVVDFLQELVGPANFVHVYNHVRKQIGRLRDARKRKAKLLPVTNPVAAAKRREATNLRKRRARKRRQSSAQVRDD